MKTTCVRIILPIRKRIRKITTETETADNSAQSDAKSGQKSSETSIEDMLDAVNALVGAKEFKDLGAYVYYTEEL